MHENDKVLVCASRECAQSVLLLDTTACSIRTYVNHYREKCEANCRTAYSQCTSKHDTYMNVFVLCGIGVYECVCMRTRVYV